MQGLGIATSARGESRTQQALLPGNRQPLDFQPGGQWCVLSGAHSDDVYTVAVSRLCLARSLNGKKKTAVKERMTGSGVGVSSQQPCLVASDVKPSSTVGRTSRDSR